MKQAIKTVWCIAAVLLVMVSLAHAKGTPGVKNGIHNLSSTGVDPIIGTPGSSFYASTEDQICVFCHTPHGGSLTGPLWNRSDPNPAGGWSHYNSATLSTYLKGLSATRTVNDESLLCLSCHDGSVGVYHVLNLPNDRNGALIENLAFGGNTNLEIVDLFGTPGARIGGSLANTSDTGDLSDDHPISFSYNQVLASAEYQVGGSKEGSLRAANLAVTYIGGTEGPRFFGTDNRVECSSCHDPHVDYLADPNYAPFLIAPNTGSGLCLSCHIK